MKEKFLMIKNQTDTTADLYFYGDIVSNWWGAWDDTDQYPEAIRDFLKGQEGKDLNIYINSGGGSVFAGMAIYNMLKRHKGHKTVYVDGLAASIASIIALAGDKIIIPSNAFLMIHKPWSWVVGNSNDFRKMADDLDAIQKGIMNVYEDNLVDGVEMAEIEKMVDEETWLNGNEASKYFSKIEVTEENNVAACASDYFKNYKNIPSNFNRVLTQPRPKNTVKTTKQKKEVNDILLQIDLI